jgi:hypothetical protein
MASLTVVDQLSVDVITHNVTDTYASKPAFEVSERGETVLVRAISFSHGPA